MAQGHGVVNAASIVFAILATVNPASTQNDVFHITFFIVLFSIITQGSLIPFAAKKLDMLDAHDNVIKTFSDYSDEIPVQFVQFTIGKGYPWADRVIKEIPRIPDLLLRWKRHKPRRLDRTCRMRVNRKKIREFHSENPEHH